MAKKMHVPSSVELIPAVFKAYALLGGGDETLTRKEIDEKVKEIMHLPKEIDDVEYYDDMLEASFPLIFHNISGAICALQTMGYLKVHVHPHLYHTMNPQYYDDYEISPERAAAIYELYIHSFDRWKNSGW